MEISLFTRILIVLFSILLNAIANAKHGQLSTEAEAEDMDGTVTTLIKGGLGSTAIMWAWLAVVTTSPLLLPALRWFQDVVEWNWLKWMAGASHSLAWGMANTTWWLLIIPAINILTGFLAHLLFIKYCEKRWGTPYAHYNEWEGFDRASGRETSHTTIWINGRNWNPVHTGTKASLKTRSSTRSSNSPSSTSMTGRHNRVTSMTGVMPIPMPSFSSGTGRKTRSSSSKKGGGGAGLGPILLAIIKFLWQLIVALFLVAIYFLYGIFGWWIMDLIRDWADEAYDVEFRPSAA